MSNETFKVDDTIFEERYVKWTQLGLTPPVLTPRELWAWGTGTGGRLGLDAVTSRSSPIQVGSLTDWNLVFAGERHSLAIKADRTLWSWGDNSNVSGNGALGLGDAVDRSSPVQVGVLPDWKSISAGNLHTLATKIDNTLWGWGGDFVGAGVLGLGAGASRSSPVQIGTLAIWASVAAGVSQSFAITTTGALWAWGSNSVGRLGLGDTASRSSPVQVGALTNWLAISTGSTHTIAVKTDGTLWSWGGSTAGQLGLGATLVNRSSPVQIGSVTTWSAVSVGIDHTLALRSTGTLWAWGEGGSGQLGSNGTADINAPAQIGALTTWSKISAGEAISLAIKTDGTLWAWGDGSSGSPGQNNRISMSSPVQVGSSSLWKSIAAGKETDHVLAVKLS